MADYVAIQNANLEPGAPWISSTAFALRDNPEAIAQGAAGAPRIQEGAMGAGSIAIDKASSISAGSSVKFRRDAETVTSSTSFVTVVDEYIANTGSSVRVYVDQRVSVGDANDRQSEVRVLRNGSVMQSWTTQSQTFVSRSVDVSFSQHDRIRIQHRETSGDAGNSTLRNMRFGTSGRSIWPGRAGYE